VSQLLVDAIKSGRSLDLGEMKDAVLGMMHGEWSPELMAQFLLALRDKGESVEEIAGAAAAMRAEMVPVTTRRTGLLDTCGTGGDGARTFNISTAAAIVVAAAGVPVAKHGNRAITSSTGSADVLSELGVNTEASVETVGRCLDEVGIGFCFAPMVHPAMKSVAGVRKQLGVPTIFNLLGPLCNPASASYQLLGVGKADVREKLAKALQVLGTERSVLVTGEDGLDEVTLGGRTTVSDVSAKGIRESVWTPADFGLLSAGSKAMLVDGPRESADVIRSIFAGILGTPRDVVVLNAAAALFVAGKYPTTRDCATAAATAIDNGGARRTLARLVEVSRS